MSNLTRRADSILVDTGGYAAPAVGYPVIAYDPGGQVNGTSASTPITMHAGHSITAGTKFIVMRGNSMVTNSYRAVSGTPTSTSVAYTGAALTVYEGDYLVNLGDDTGTTGPSYQRTTLSPAIYNDMEGSTAQIAQSTVTTDSNGSFSYWWNGQQTWELVRNTLGAPVRLNIDVVSTGIPARVTSLPATATPGQRITLNQGTGLPDINYVYMKTSSDTYDWVEEIRAP